MKYVNFPPYVELFWLEDINVVQLKWTGLYLSLDKFKEVANAAKKMLSVHNSSIWIADQYDSKGAFNKEVLDYIANELVEDVVANYEVKLVLTIMPKDKGISSLSAKRWVGDVQEMGVFKMATFPTIEACKKWIIEDDNK